MVQGDSSSFADRLQRLYARAAEEGRKPKDTELARHIEYRTGKSITSAQIGNLRKGTRSSPRIDVVEAIADFFQVDPSYFLGPDADGSTPDGRLESARILHRISTMTDRDRQIITEVLDRFERDTDT